MELKNSEINGNQNGDPNGKDAFKQNLKILKFVDSQNKLIKKKQNNNINRDQKVTNKKFRQNC